MNLISDILLITGAFGLAFYCLVLSRRLKSLARSDAGLGATIDTLSERVDTLARTAAEATEQADAAAARLEALTQEARTREDELAFLLAGLGDEGAAAPTPPPLPEPVFARRAAGGAR